MLQLVSLMSFQGWPYLRIFLQFSKKFVISSKMGSIAPEKDLKWNSITKAPKRLLFQKTDSENVSQSPNGLIRGDGGYMKFSLHRNKVTSGGYQ